jgi:hypothetical protein
MAGVQFGVENGGFARLNAARDGLTLRICPEKLAARKLAGGMFVSCCGAIDQ